MNNQVLNGKSFIEETDSFYLNPYYSFKGNVIIDSSKDYLLFEGETRIHLSCDKLNESWIPFNSYVDPDNVIIDLKTDKKRTKKNHYILIYYLELMDITLCFGLLKKNKRL